jgi:DNA-directed RNA polymerase subunit RPC12/RpoP
MDFKATDQVKETIGKRGLKVDDVMDVVKTAEQDNKKIIDKSTGKIIAKKVINNVTVYADYNIEKGILKSHANVNSAYSHRMTLGKIVNASEPAPYTCAHCNAQTSYGTAEMSYIGVSRNGPAVVCPKCGDVWVEEYLATKTIAAAEGLFEKKKA